MIVAEFSKLKLLQGSAFNKLRSFLRAKIEKIFIAPAYTFDNVTGKFPIGFKIWNTQIKEIFSFVSTDIYNEKGDFIGRKGLYSIDKNYYINKWISSFKVNDGFIGFLAGTNGNDFQQNGIVYILNRKEQMANPRGLWISSVNLIAASLYFSVRKCIEQTWLNDRDQFLYPNDNWKNDIEFQNDSLAFTLFNTNILSSEGTNHWIPFTEYEVNAQAKFESNFMTDFIKGKIKKESGSNTLFEQSTTTENKPLVFSEEATAVFDAGRELWKYYHSQPNVNVNASLYDIREYFQGRNDKGRMNSKSDDAIYSKLITELRNKLAVLGDKIKPKVYEYEFLKQ